MMMKKILLTTMMLSLALISLSAQQLSEMQAKQKINAAAAALQTMQCDFLQTKHLKMLRQELTVQGKMYYQKSDKLRWEYTEPYQYIFILNGDKVLLKHQNRHDIIDVNQNKLFKGIAQIMMNSVVGGCLTDDKRFQTTITSTPKEWIATLLPLRNDMKQLFQTIIIHFNRQTSMVAVVELVEKNDDKTIITLRNIRQNEPIKDSFFAVH